MPRFYVVVDDLKDWSPYYPSRDVITFDHYLNHDHTAAGERVRVINLCRSYRYLGTAYYCALLAEARGHRVFPSVRTLNDLSSKSLSAIQLGGVDKLLDKLQLDEGVTSHRFLCWFGECREPVLAALAKAVFERFPCPLLEVHLEHRDGGWRIDGVRAVSLRRLRSAEEQEAFANAFEAFSRKMWRVPKLRKHFRFDLAILADRDEAMPPSDARALKRFVKAAEELGIAADLIGKKDFMRLPEYDGLFIRETTSLAHHTYHFAKKAEAEGMVVMDDPTSIMRCTNKVYLAELLRRHKVATPKTEILRRDEGERLQSVAEELGFPVVLKVPDGSFSRGVVKVKNAEELAQESAQLLKKSALLLAQEYMYTDYDWRIGVLNNHPLYACRYYMVRNHWQIYHHGGAAVKSGGFDAIAVADVPAPVLKAAVRASKLIGNGFYGVDLKQSGDRVVVIEVNDNPSVDAGVEDKHLGQELYLCIMREFLRRMEAKRR